MSSRIYDLSPCPPLVLGEEGHRTAHQLVDNTRHQCSEQPRCPKRVAHSSLFSLLRSGPAPRISQWFIFQPEGNEA